MEMADVDGALVGGASLDPETFSKLVFLMIDLLKDDKQCPSC
jgi:triosephosphate isomerase